MVAKSAFNEALLLWISLKTIHQQLIRLGEQRTKEMFICSQASKYNLCLFLALDDGWARISCFIDFGLATIGIQPKIDIQMPNVDWMGCPIKGVKNDGTNKQ